MHVNMAIVMASVAQNRRKKNMYILFLFYGSILKVVCCEGALQWTDSSIKRTQRTPKKTHITMDIAMAIVDGCCGPKQAGEKHVHFIFIMWIDFTL